MMIEPFRQIPQKTNPIKYGTEPDPHTFTGPGGPTTVGQIPVYPAIQVTPGGGGQPWTIPGGPEPNPNIPIVGGTTNPNTPNTTPNQATPGGPGGGQLPAGSPDGDGAYETPWSSYNPSGWGGGAFGASSGNIEDLPVGGAYGAYEQLASGEMNPMQVLAGLGYADVANQGGYKEMMDQLMGGAQTRATANDPNLQTAWDFFSRLAGNTSEPEEGQLRAYQNMLAKPGFSDEVKGAIRDDANAGLNAQYANAAEEMRSAAGRTGSPVGMYAGMADVNRGVGKERAGMERANKIDFAKEEARQKELAAAGLGTNAGLSLQRQLGAGEKGLATIAQKFGQQQQATGQANDLLTSYLQRELQGGQGLQGLSAALTGQMEAGAGGLAHLSDSEKQQMNQMYSVLANILGNQQESYNELGQTTGSFGMGV